MARAAFRTKTGETEPIAVSPGQSVAEVLRLHGIPANNVITYVNGEIVPESLATVGPDDYIEFEQIRHYDLGVTRRPHERVFNVDNPVYVKSVLFDEKGKIENWSEQFDRNSYPTYIEQTFAESVLGANLIEEGDHMVVGLSGGRDSVAFLKLLERTRDRFPEFRMTAATVTGLPDWEESESMHTAKAACDLLDIEHVIVAPERLQETFKLSRPYVEVMNEIVGQESHPLSMVISHHVLRRMLELEAQARGAEKVVLGLNADDLVSTLVTWFTTGFRMGPIPLRPIRAVSLRLSGLPNYQERAHSLPGARGSGVQPARTTGKVYLRSRRTLAFLRHHGSPLRPMAGDRLLPFRSLLQHTAQS